MAVTDVNISQSNITGDSNLLSVHSPIIFLVNVTFTVSAPELFYCKIYDADDVLLDTFKCIPYLELTSDMWQFMFIADEILRGYMDSFDDQLQSGGSIVFIDGFAKIFKLTFIDETGTKSDSVTISALHAVRQFGEDVNAESIFENESQVYYAYENFPVYAYFYNDDEDNEISNVPGLEDFDSVTDYDDEEFTDVDDEVFYIFVTD